MQVCAWRPLPVGRVDSAPQICAAAERIPVGWATLGGPFGSTSLTDYLRAPIRVPTTMRPSPRYAADHVLYSSKTVENVRQVVRWNVDSIVLHRQHRELARYSDCGRSTRTATRPPLGLFRRAVDPRPLYTVAFHIFGGRTRELMITGSR